MTDWCETREDNSGRECSLRSNIKHWNLVTFTISIWELCKFTSDFRYNILLSKKKKKAKKTRKIPIPPPPIKTPNNSYSYKAANKGSNTITELRTISQILQIKHKILSTAIHCTLQRNSCKKSLKIPKRWSESVYQRRTDNSMAKRKRTKVQTMIYKT